jgi:hypothetical protein
MNDRPECATPFETWDANRHAWICALCGEVHWTEDRLGDEKPEKVRERDDQPVTDDNVIRLPQPWSRDI